MTFSFFLPPARNQRVGLGFTDRLGGFSPPPGDSLNLSRHRSQAQDLRRNFDVVRAASGQTRLALCAQVHGTQVIDVDASYPFLDDTPGSDPQADALVSSVDRVVLVIRVADCVPVLFTDESRQLIAAAHAGRVGLLGGVLQAAVAAMVQRGAHGISAWIGPHIGPECYEVPLEMAEAAWALLPASRARSARGTPAIDLGAGAQCVLEQVGVRVERVDPCTSCDTRFFSHRRDQGLTGRQAGVIWRETGAKTQEFQRV